MKKVNRILLLLTLAFTYGYSTVVFAQQDAVNVEYPAIGINDLIMKEYSFVPGKSLSADLYLENVSSGPSEFKYKIELYSANKNTSGGISQTLLNASSLSNTEILLAGEQKTIALQYLVPAYVQDHITMSVLVFNDAGRMIGRKNLYLLNKDISRTQTPQGTSLSIENITFTQDNNTFQPLFGNSTYLIDGNKDLTISVEMRGNTNEDALLSIEFKDLYNQQSSSTVYQSIDLIKDKSASSVVLSKGNLKPGVYEVYVTPINVKKEQIAPSKKVNIGVEGQVGVIHAFNLQKLDAGRIHKKSKVKIIAEWSPIIEISKKLSSMTTDPVFDARIELRNESNQVISSTTISNVSNTFDIDVPINSNSNVIFGKVDILFENSVIASYQRKLFDQPELEKNNILAYVVSVLVLIIAYFVYVFLRKRYAGIVAVLIVSIFIPQSTMAAWTLKSTTSFDNTYPKGQDATVSTWQAQTYPWAGVASYSRACAKKTAASGASSNYVTQTLPILSADEKMYPWENSWYHIPVGGWNWYQADKVRNGNWPTIGSGLIPGVFTKTSFVHANALAKAASIDDDLYEPIVGQSSWLRYRPLRINSTNGMGTNTRFALATTTFSNLSNWLNVTFNAKAYGTYKTTQTSGIGFIAEGGGPKSMTLYGSADAEHLDYLNLGGGIADFEPGLGSFNIKFPNNINNYANLKNALAIGTSTVSTWIDAGSYANFGASFGDDSRFIKSADVPMYNSRPGTYKLFNFLATYRDEADGASSAATQKHDCISANVKVHEADYQIIPNSYIEVVLFYDVDGNGTFDPGTEKVIANRYADETSINGGSPLKDYYPSSLMSCTLPGYNQYLLNGVTSILGTTTNPIAVLKSSPNWQYINGVQVNTEYSTPYGKSKMAGAYVKTLSQVINPLYYPDLGNGSRYTPPSNLRDAVYKVSDVDAIDNTNTPSAWALASGVDSSNAIGQAYYNSTGNLTILSGYSVCGQTIIGNSNGTQDDGDGNISVNYPSFGEDISYLYNTEVLNNPVSIANNTTPYFKFPVNWALSRYYEVGVDESILPTGWVATTNPKNVDLGSVAIGNQHKVEYFGVTYNANGVCGSAKNTPSGSPVTTAPSTNLCSAGSSTSVVSNEQDFTWSCNGYGTGSTAACTKPKCGGSNSYYCAANNSCVADSDACTISGVCGSATTELGRGTAGVPSEPSTDLCSAGALYGIVADGGASSFTWACEGANGGTISPTCSQPKCSSAAGLRYCSALNRCEASCPVTATTTLIFDAVLNPKIVRNVSNQCIFSWKTSSSAELPVSCTLDGVGLGNALPDIQRSTPVSVGSHTLSCTNTEVTQSTTTKCLLNPSFREI